MSDSERDTARYTRFAERLVAGDPVEMTTGPGGISFYVTVDGVRRFACHFNARPRKSEADRGFVDFKPRQTGLDVDRVVPELEAQLAGRAECRRGAAWWSAHFAASEDLLVAAAFRRAVVEPLLMGSDATNGR